MNTRRELLERLLQAQGEVRSLLKAAVPASVYEDFAGMGSITVQQMEVMHRLLRGDEMTMHDVAAAQGIGPSGATQLVDRLERRGLVERVRDAHDRRVQRVVPTAPAKAFARRFKAGMSRAADEVLAVLDDDELRTYVEMTERMAQGRRPQVQRRSA